MSDDIKKYQCSACGGPLNFNIEKQKLICEYCETEYEKDYFENQEEEQEEVKATDWKTEGVVKESEVIKNQSGFICTSCGAEIIADENTAATECMYCGNPVVITDNVSEMVKPDMLIPFKIDKEEAQKMLKSFYNKKILLPKTFKDQNRIKKIAGVYVPFWLFSGKGSGNMTYNAQKVRTYTDGDYDVVETRYYHADREGSLEFEKIPVDASKKMENEYMDGLEPYKYEELQEFSSMYMAGFFADKFDEGVDECRSRAKKRIINTTKDELRNTVTGYTSVTDGSGSIQMTDEEVNYVMLPVWMLNTKHEGKMYHFAINGQTGRVSGDLPIDKKKQKFIFIGITVLSYIVFALIASRIIF